MTQELRTKLEQIPYTYINKIIDWLNKVNKSSTDFSLTENNSFYIFDEDAIFSSNSPHILICANKQDSSPNAVYYVDFPELGNGKKFRQMIYGDSESIDKVIDKAIEVLRAISLTIQRREYLYRLLFFKNFDSMEGLKIYHNSNDNYDIIYNLNVRELEYAISKLQDFSGLNPDSKVSTYLITIRENECYIKFDETDVDNNIINAFYLVHARNNQDFPKVYKFTHDWAKFETNRDVVINRFQNILEKKKQDHYNFLTRLTDKANKAIETDVENDSFKFPIPTVNLQLVINDEASITLPSDIVDLIIKQLIKQVNAKKIPDVIRCHNVKDWTITRNNEIEWKSSVSLERILTNSKIKLEFEK